MTICKAQQDTIGNKLASIYKICRDDRDAKAMSDQAFVQVAKILKEIERCKFLNASLESLESDLEEIKHEIDGVIPVWTTKYRCLDCLKEALDEEKDPEKLGQVIKVCYAILLNNKERINHGSTG